MRTLLILLLTTTNLAASLSAQQRLPKDFWDAKLRKVPARQYEIITFDDRMVLSDSSFWTALFNLNVSTTVRFSDALAIVHLQDGIRSVTLHEWRGTILETPGCLMTQISGPREPASISQVTPQGFTVTGKAGMALHYICSAAARRPQSEIDALPQLKEEPGQQFVDCAKTPEICVITGKLPKGTYKDMKEICSRHPKLCKPKAALKRYNGREAIQ